MKWLKQNNIFTSTWFSSAQNSFIPKFLVDFCDKIYRALTVLARSKTRRPRTFWRKYLVFHWRKISYFVFTFTFPLVLLFISSFQIYIYIYIYISLLILCIYYIQTLVYTSLRNQYSYCQIKMFYLKTETFNLVRQYQVL